MSFERPRQPEQGNDLRSIDLSEIAKAIDDYNRQYNIGTLAAEQIMGSMGENVASKVTPDEISTKNATILHATGLGVESVRNIGVLLGYDEESDVHAQELRFNLDDGKRFAAYLGALDEATITTDQARGLTTVAESLTKQLTSEYQLENPNDERLIELFGNLQRIIEGYQSLDVAGKNSLSESVSQLSEYLAIARQKYLREYIIAQRAKLLTTNEDRAFGPYDWHGDSTPDSCREYWGQALNALREIKKNQNAKPLFEETVENLKSALKFAKLDLTESNEEVKSQDPDVIELDIPPRDISAYKIAIDDIYEELEQISKN